MDQSQPFHLHGIHLLNQRGRSSHDRRRHAWHEMLLVVSGRYRCRLDGTRTIDRAAGSGVVIPAGTEHRPVFRRDGTVSLLLLQWNGAVRTEGPRLFTDPFGRVRTLLFWLWQDAPRLDREQQACIAACLDLACALPQPDLPPALSIVMRTIDEDLAETHSLTALASRAGVSPRTLTRLFQRHCGCPPKTWMIRQRLLAAAQHLATGASAAAAARSVGICTGSYLSRLAREHLGCELEDLRSGRAVGRDSG